MHLSRPDLAIIQNWIQSGSRVLDLGCGSGDLLDFLQQKKQVHGYGLEIDDQKITECVAKGVNVIEQNLDDGLSNFKDQSYDVVVMTQALQAMKRPDLMLEEMLRVGKECIVTFPNFAYWRCRFYLALKGEMPVSKSLPHTWYNTPNIHLSTFRDFEQLCKSRNLRIIDRAVGNSEHESHWATNLWPNLFGELAIYRVTR